MSKLKKMILRRCTARKPRIRISTAAHQRISGGRADIAICDASACVTSDTNPPACRRSLGPSRTEDRSHRSLALPAGRTRRLPSPRPRLAGSDRSPCSPGGPVAFLPLARAWRERVASGASRVRAPPNPPRRLQLVIPANAGIHTAASHRTDAALPPLRRHCEKRTHRTISCSALSLREAHPPHNLLPPQRCHCEERSDEAISCPRSANASSTS